MPTLWRIYLAGLVILAGAVVVNIVAGAIGVKTWYEVLKPIPEEGIKAVVRTVAVWDVLFLFVLYPALLGLFGYLVLR